MVQQVSERIYCLIEMADLAVHGPKAEIWRILSGKFYESLCDEHVALLNSGFCSILKKKNRGFCRNMVIFFERFHGEI
jgi:hypothetical protein